MQVATLCYLYLMGIDNYLLFILHRNRTSKVFLSRNHVRDRFHAENECQHIRACVWRINHVKLLINVFFFFDLFIRAKLCGPIHEKYKRILRLLFSATFNTYVNFLYQ